MSRCEGYYPVENRRCDREAAVVVAGGDGGRYAVCPYHGREAWRTRVARWSGESDARRSAPTGLVAESRERSFVAASP